MSSTGLPITDHKYDFKNQKYIQYLINKSYPEKQFNLRIMPFKTIAERIKILHYYNEKKNKKKTCSKFGIDKGQLKHYIADEAKYKTAIQAGKNQDEERNKKRKGKKSKAAEARAKKRQRVGVAGFQRSEQYVWLDRITLAWFTVARAKKFAVTPRMIQLFATVECRKVRQEEIQNQAYWYRSFRLANSIVVRRVTGLRRKMYTPEKLQEISIGWQGFLRKWKLRRNYIAPLIINMDEIPLYMDMCRGWTMDVAGGKHVDVNFTNSDKLRFTGTAAAAADGTKLDFSCIFRLTKKGNFPLELREPFEHNIKVYCTEGGSQNEWSMCIWIDEILLPHVHEHGGGLNGLWTLLIMDPAKAHLTETVLVKLRQNRIDVAIMPASTTHLFQLVDVCIGKSFKDAIYEQWAQWMLNCNDDLGFTAAGNRKHPTRKDCLDWVEKAWNEFDEEIIKKSVPKVYMSPEAGPEIEGYQDQDFTHEVPENPENLIEGDVKEN